MSSVLIKGMKMPTDCGDCQLKNGGRFILTGQKIPWEWCERLDDCPLVKVPTLHGDLIDRDAIVYPYADKIEINNADVKWHPYARKEDIDKVPVVIKAERSR